MPVARLVPPTIAEVARMAGVSVPTVSKVVNGRSDVAPDTRAVVEKLIREHGYRRQRKPAIRTALVEVVFHEIAGEYPIEILKGVQRAAGKHQLAVVLSEPQGRQTPGRGWIEGVLARRPTGVVAVFSDLVVEQRDQLTARGIPFVVLDPVGQPGYDFPSVGATNWSGGLAATQYLLELGHRRIATITGPDRAYCSRARLDGYRTALDTAGVPVDPELIRSAGFQIVDGLQHAAELLRRPDPPTAIFALNDGMALGVYHAAAAAGLRIPEDLSVVGFDAHPSTKWMIPPLTTVRQPLADMGAAATRMVIDLAAGVALASNRPELATELVVRRSAAPPSRR